jgi:hypothetical protein
MASIRVNGKPVVCDPKATLGDVVKAIDPNTQSATYVDGRSGKVVTRRVSDLENVPVALASELNSNQANYGFGSN